MATPARGMKIKKEHANWNLNTEQEAWLREQNWQPVLVELEVPEQPQPTRQPQLLPITNPVQPATPTSIDSIRPEVTPPTAAPELAKAARGESSRIAHEQSPEPARTNQASELHDANTTKAEVISVRGHTRARQERRPNREQTASQQTNTEPSSGLASTSAQEKAAMEKCAREYATKELENLGYTVQPMGSNNPGYDLKATKTGELLKVEVKGHGGESQTVLVTQREWEEHIQTQAVQGVIWELWNIQNLSKASGKNPTIQRVRHIPNSAKRDNGYWIDLSQCSGEPTTQE